MARVDYEGAWHALQAEVAEPGITHRGQRFLLQRMAQLQQEHAVPESLLERAARIHGLPRLMQAIPEVESPAEQDSVLARTAAASGHRHDPQGGHDGRTNGHPEAG